MAERTPSPATTLVVLAAAALPPIVVRTALLLQYGLAPTLADARGAAADLAAACLAAALLGGIARLPHAGRWFAAAAAAGWTILNFANFEHILQLGSIADSSYAGYLLDEAFFRGSALSPSRPGLLIATTLVTAALTGAVLSPQRRARLGPIAIAGAAGLAVSVAIPLMPTAAAWRQSDLLGHQLRLFVHGSQPAAVADGRARTDLLPRDLDAPSILAGEARARNVLLVILEGVSGAYLESLREADGASSDITMPRLDRIARQGLAYSSFVATQRQTNRGEFALLCGETPSLVSGEAKMTALAGAGPLGCLPGTLRQLGFSTTYLQASPLAFMLKDQFMPGAGFTRVLGDDWFENPNNRNHWGVDDRSLFNGASRLIGELQRQEQPWFLTLLTVGTHHHYNVPQTFRGRAPQGSKAQAFEYLDGAVSDFVEQLDAAGVLADTLVLITSDESQAEDPGAPDFVNMLNHGWGFLIVLAPSQPPALIRQVFAQPDVPISVLDYLGAAHREPKLNGRSVFRRYAGGRELYWGNTYFKMVAGLATDNTLTICTEDLRRCSGTQTEPERLFTPPRRITEASPAAVERLRRAVQLSRDSHVAAEVSRSISLIAEGAHRVTAAAAEQYLFGGQFVTLPAGSRADFDISVGLTGHTGWIDVVINFMLDLEPQRVWSKRLEVGERLELRSSYSTDTDRTGAEWRFWITAAEGDDLTLDVGRADVVVQPIGAGSPQPEERFDIIPSPTRP